MNKRRWIYVCSPLRGTPPYTTAKYNKNLRKATDFCREVFEAGETPIAPHLFFSSFMDDHDPEQRSAGMTAGIEMLEKCAEVWVFDSENGISEGMKAEIQHAGEIGIPVIYR